MKYIFALFFILVIVFCNLINKLIKLSREEQIKKWVAWCLPDIKNKGWKIREFPLSSYIKNAQCEYKIEDAYKLNGTDWETVEEILKEFQNYLEKAFFSNQLQFIKSKYTIDEQDYFMYALYTYLYCDKTIYTRGKLNDYGIILHKLLLITHVYINKKPALNSSKINFVYFINLEERYKEIILTKRC